MSKITAITIDGPAGAGKSTISKMSAKKLRFVYIDSGAMYRGITLKALKHKLNLKNRKQIVDLTKNTDIDFKKNGGNLNLYIDNKDVSNQIRQEIISRNTSFIANNPGVRKILREKQREIAKNSNSGVIMEGRDIGTCVLPDAKFKFYLDAGLFQRVKRRYNQLKRNNTIHKYESKELKKNIILRDKSDITRKTNPLRIPEDATVIDSTYMTVSDVVNYISSTVLKYNK